MMSLARVLEGRTGLVTFLPADIHGVHLGRIGGHVAATVPSTCSGFALDQRRDAPVGFQAGPYGRMVVNSAYGGLRNAIPLNQGDGPYPFRATGRAAETENPKGT